MTYQGNVVSRKALLEQVWGIHYEGASNVVDTIIVSLRRKLADQSNMIETVRGVGYRLNIDSELTEK
ncbi:helix-turn-helix domain-containing protein [Vibrio sp. CDRSL-10 TSBA]